MCHELKTLQYIISYHKITSFRISTMHIVLCHVIISFYLCRSDIFHSDSQTRTWFRQVTKALHESDAVYIHHITLCHVVLCHTLRNSILYANGKLEMFSLARLWACDLRKCICMSVCELVCLLAQLSSCRHFIQPSAGLYSILSIACMQGLLSLYTIKGSSRQREIHSYPRIAVVKDLARAVLLRDGCRVHGRPKGRYYIESCFRLPL